MCFDGGDNYSIASGLLVYARETPLFNSLQVGGSSLYDPFAGAGTVLTEAVMLGQWLSAGDTLEHTACVVPDWLRLLIAELRGSVSVGFRVGHSADFRTRRSTGDWNGLVATRHVCGKSRASITCRLPLRIAPMACRVRAQRGSPTTAR